MCVTCTTSSTQKEAQLKTLSRRSHRAIAEITRRMLGSEAAHNITDTSGFESVCTKLEFLSDSVIHLTSKTKAHSSLADSLPAESCLEEILDWLLNVASFSHQQASSDSAAWQRKEEGMHLQIQCTSTVACKAMRVVTNLKLSKFNL